MIPTILHAIWLGPKPITEQNEGFLKRRAELHPKWEVRLWRDADVVNFPMINRNLYNKVRQPAQKGDLLRLELLYTFGGITADLDFDFFKPLDPLLGVSCFCGRQHTGRLLPFAPGIMGAEPKNPFIRAMIDGVPEGLKRKEGIHRQTGPGLLCRTLAARPGECHVYPKPYFYPPDRNDPESYVFHVGDHAWR